MKKIILIGAGGHASSCIEVIRSKKEFRVIGVVGKEDSKNLNKKVKFIKHKNFLDKKKQAENLLIAIGQLKLGIEREKIFNFYKKNKFKFPVITSSTCYISKDVKIGEGTIIMHNSFINTGSEIGKNCIINSGAVIEHDCIIEDNVNIAPGAIILGGSKIKKNSFIGSGSVIKQKSVINRNTIISTKSYFKSK
jgi:UDP-perosamine 4-acetyltransferase